MPRTIFGSTCLKRKCLRMFLAMFQMIMQSPFLIHMFQRSYADTMSFALSTFWAMPPAVDAVGAASTGICHSVSRSAAGRLWSRAVRFDFLVHACFRSDYRRWLVRFSMAYRLQRLAPDRLANSQALFLCRGCHSPRPDGNPFAKKDLKNSTRSILVSS